MTDEIWKPIPEFEDSYEASTHGRVRSIDRLITRPNSGPFWRQGTVLRPQASGPTGRLQVNLKGRLYQVHRLILATFVAPCPPGLEGLHFDDDGTNNQIENLRWGTRSENLHDRVRNGRHPAANQTHCIHEHEFTKENTYRRRNGTRACKTCARNRKGQVAA